MLVIKYRLTAALAVAFCLAVVLLVCGKASGGKPGGGGGNSDPTAGRPISFVRLNGSSPVFQLVRLDGSGAVTVNSDKNLLVSWPRWSPDGAMLGGYFKDLTDSAGNVVDTGLMVMAADGSNERLALSALDFDLYNLSRPGVVDSGLSSRISSSQPNHATWLGNGALVFSGYSAYAPSFFGQSDPGYATSGSRLFIVDADGEIYPLTETPIQNVPLYHDLHPDWSPTLGKIVFVSNRSGYDELYAINPDGTGLVQITDFNGNVSTNSDRINLLQPRWSPDGTRIALRVSPVSGYYNLWILDVDLSQAGPGLGGRVQDVDPFKNRNDADEHMPSWSPTGDYIAFQRSSGFSGRGQYSDILIADAVTGDETVIVESKQGIGYPDWIPVP